MKPPVDPRKVLEGLIEHFDRSLPTLKSANYNETQARREFIDPFFKLLGWDVDNEQGFAEAYKDVIHEDAIKIGSFTKAPDYCFRIGGTRKFFVEAKKPAVNIKEDVSPAYQLRRYAWSAKLPLSILTDFEEFAVYDCRVKPEKTDKASTARLHIFSFRDYLDKWEELYWLFSKEAVLKGSFDKFAESKKGKRGTAEVDDAFLQDIEAWRALLAQNLALRNPELNYLDLNSAVQRTIDRIIFLRIAEDRGLESYGRLQALLNGTEVFPRLRELFREADERYNSGLFHFKAEKGQAEPPDLLTTRLQVDDKPLKEILAKLYYPESPYEFSVLPAEILGQVYEQFLGKVIRLTAGHRAVVEDKPEVKKAGGVYYTPKYIVDYIVKNTVGKMVEGKTPRAISGRRAGPPPTAECRGGALSPPAGGHGDPPLRILDPACGSGSFLLGAYQYLLDWYRDRYTEESPEKHAKGKEPVLYQGPGGAWRLTTAERKRILLAHIYGVDIDPQAVEVTKLSLLLKVLEGETAESLSRQTRVLPFQERALPDLANNIKCGNSLIGSDFYQGKQGDLFDQEEIARVNAFDWEDEFPEVFLPQRRRGAEGKDTHREDERTGGFDVVIGNPPWGSSISTEERAFLARCHPEVADFESSQYFLISGRLLMNPSSILGMIVPNTFALNVFAAKCRQSILEKYCIGKMVDLSDSDVFSGPSVRAMIIIMSATGEDDCITASLDWQHETLPIQVLAQAELSISDTWKEYFVRQDAIGLLVRRILDGHPKLSDYCDVKQGYIPYRTTTLTRRFGPEKATRIVESRSWHSDNKIDNSCQRELQGSDVSRYSLKWSGVWVKYGEWISTYLPIDLFSGPRVLVREITGKPPHVLLSAYTEEIMVHNPSVLMVHTKMQGVSPKFVLGVMNSKLLSAVFLHIAPKAKKGLFPKMIITDAKRLPFPDIDVAQKRSKNQHDQLVFLVDRLLDLHKRLPSATANHDRTLIERQIATTDKEIDRLVYDLYGLTEEEIRIVEGAVC